MTPRVRTVNDRPYGKRCISTVGYGACDVPYRCFRAVASVSPYNKRSLRSTVILILI